MSLPSSDAVLRALVWTLSGLRLTVAQSHVATHLDPACSHRRELLCEPSCTLSQIHRAEAADWSESARWQQMPLMMPLWGGCAGLGCLSSHWRVAVACREHCCAGRRDEGEENNLSPAEHGTLLSAKLCVYLPFLPGPSPSILPTVASTSCVLVSCRCSEIIVIHHTITQSQLNFRDLVLHVVSLILFPDWFFSCFVFLLVTLCCLIRSHSPVAPLAHPIKQDLLCNFRSSGQRTTFCTLCAKRNRSHQYHNPKEVHQDTVCRLIRNLPRHRMHTGTQGPHRPLNHNMSFNFLLQSLIMSLSGWEFCSEQLILYNVH